MLGGRRRVGGKRRGHRKKPKPSSTQPEEEWGGGGDDATSSATASAVQPVVGDGSEALDQPKLYLTVDYKTTVETSKEAQALYPEYGESGKLYTCHSAAVPIVMSRSDQRMYPKVYDALKACKDKFVNIEFNALKKEPVAVPVLDPWGALGIMLANIHVGPVLNRNRRNQRQSNAEDRDVRVRVKESEFLRRLQDDGLLNLTVHVKGHVSRVGCRRGRKIPLKGKNQAVALKVGKLDGETEGVVLKMPPGLFATVDLQGIFTVELQWEGPEVVVNDFSPLYRKLMEDVPKDVMIILPGRKVYECHSILLKAWSPVFTAMLDCNMIEGETRKIRMTDVDPNVWEVFQNFLYSGDLTGAFESCEICLGLLVLCNKYNVAHCEKTSKTLLEEKPDDWFRTDIALDLFLLADGLPNSEKLFERAKSILRSRKSELQDLKLYQELLEEDPEWDGLGTL